MFRSFCGFLSRVNLSTMYTIHASEHRKTWKLVFHRLFVASPQVILQLKVNIIRHRSCSSDDCDILLFCGNENSKAPERICIRCLCFFTIIKRMSKFHSVSSNIFSSFPSQRVINSSFLLFCRVVSSSNTLCHKWRR